MVRDFFHLERTALQLSSFVVINSSIPIAKVTDIFYLLIQRSFDKVKLCNCHIFSIADELLAEALKTL